MRILHLIIAILFSILPQTLRAESPLKKASFIPQWSPQAQFAGYYVAYEKGFYSKQGIDLRIHMGGPNSPPLEFLEKGKATFATQWLSTAIQKRSQGVKLINIGQIIQRSALMLVAKKSRGIHKPQDINGKKVSLWREEFQIQPMAFLKKYNLNVKIVPQSYSVNLFLREGVDVASAMWYNEYHTILNAGIDPDELTTFFFHEHGLNFLEDGIYTLENTFKKDPELCHAFVKASIEGWLYAFSHPDKALDIVMRYMSAAKTQADRVHQKWMLERMKDLILPRGDFDTPMGKLASSDFTLVAKELHKSGFIKKIPDVNSFYPKDFQYAKK
ncbi:MAG: ABC transporter substrate-binding protein [Deltaproteobacteria bacterium]|nr:ABC transporter substrate-binding protein [Deltaproteobacteria bacterium]